MFRRIAAEFHQCARPEITNLEDEFGTVSFRKPLCPKKSYKRRRRIENHIGYETNQTFHLLNPPSENEPIHDPFPVMCSRVSHNRNTDEAVTFKFLDVWGLFVRNFVPNQMSPLSGHNDNLMTKRCQLAGQMVVTPTNTNLGQ